MMRRELTLDATVENLPQVLAFLEEGLEAVGCSLKTQTQISMAAEEIFVNIAHYAYAPQVGEAAVCFEITKEPAAVRITFSDGGKPFDPTAKADPNVKLSAEDREIGGLGIFMTKKIMDDVRYEYKDGKNVLTLQKRL